MKRNERKMFQESKRKVKIRGKYQWNGKWKEEVLRSKWKVKYEEGTNKIESETKIWRAWLWRNVLKKSENEREWLSQFGRHE